MTYNQVYEYLANLRDLINEYEELIEFLKTTKNLVSKDETTLFNMFKRIEKIKNKTKTLMNVYKNTKLENIDANTLKYIKTYNLYLEMVSIPYIIDLLTDALNILQKRGNGHAVEIISKTINEFKELKNSIINTSIQRS
ncbi:MAG: hypothetical protein J7J82_05345 [Staphylothermus sp.]|nr:hypothetical protein [Staphylothermus sp.]